MKAVFYLEKLVAYMSYSVRIIDLKWLCIAAAAGILAWIIAKRARAGALITYIVLVLASTVFLREDYGVRRMMLTPLWSYKSWLQGTSSSLIYENIANIIMMIPVGFGVCSLVRKHRLGKALALTAGLELLIEGAQLVFRRGLCETDDLINGLAGAVIGCMIYGICRIFALAARPGRRRLQPDL